MATPLLGTISALESHHPRGPWATLTSSPVGFLNLSDRDIYWSEQVLYSRQSVTPGNSLTSYYANATASTSSYAYFAHILLQQRTMTDRWSETPSGALSAWLSYFRDITSSVAFDIFNDTALGLGDVGVISVKKYEFGEGIKPLSFTANMDVDGTPTDFVDAASANNEWGILVADGVSAGIVFYDLGIALIHGPNINYPRSASALNTVYLDSSYKTWQINVFCTASPQQLNIPTNDSAFYIAAVTANPRDYGTLSGYDLAYEWGTTDDSSSASRGNYFLTGVVNEPTYISSIGLYDDDNNLLAIAKLSQPIRRPRTMPITFKIPIDFT